MDFKNLYRKMERVLGHIEGGADVFAAATAMGRSMVDTLATELGILGGRVYARDDGHYQVREVFGDTPKDALGVRVPADYDPIMRLRESGILYMRRGDSGFDADIEDALKVDTFAALMAGDQDQYIVSFSLKADHDPAHIQYALSAAHQLFSLKEEQVRMRDILMQAREIQRAMLPGSDPKFEGFELAARSEASDVVGGDLYDFLPISQKILGVAIGDVSGHGLPAALQARDVIIGLRMGTEEHMKMTHTISKLNRVIGRGKLASKYVSLFYAEIERNGNLIYTNAGHNPPVMYWTDKDEFRELDQGGFILGPKPDAEYSRGHQRFFPGDIVVLYTDGIVERQNAEGDEYGLTRLKDLIRNARELSAREITDSIFAEVREFGGGTPPADDMTVVTIRCLEIKQ